MGKSLEDLYSDDTPGDTGVSVANDEAPKVEAEKADTQETKQDATQDGAPPAPQDNPDDRIPRAALTDERKKRQSLEATNKELQRRLDDLEKRIQPQSERQAIDPLVDPDGFMKEMQVARFEDRLELTSEFVRSQVGEDKFNAAEQAVLRVANANPQFAERFSQEVARAKNPGRYTYEIGQGILDQIEANDPAKARAKLRDEIKAELMSELGLTSAQADKAVATQQPAVSKPNVPTSLAGLQSNGPRNPGARPIKRRSLNELYNP